MGWQLGWGLEKVFQTQLVRGRDVSPFCPTNLIASSHLTPTFSLVKVVVACSFLPSVLSKLSWLALSNVLSCDSCSQLFPTSVLSCSWQPVVSYLLSCNTYWASRLLSSVLSCSLQPAVSYGLSCHAVCGQLSPTFRLVMLIEPALSYQPSVLSCWLQPAVSSLLFCYVHWASCLLPYVLSCPLLTVVSHFLIMLPLLPPNSFFRLNLLSLQTTSTQLFTTISYL